MRFIAITSALIGAAMAGEIEARWATTSSAPASTSSCAPKTVTVTVWGSSGSGKGSNSTSPSPTATGHYYVNSADSVTYGAWTVVAGIAAAMLL